MRFVVPAMLLVVGIIHLLPVAGVLGVDQLAALYGITITDPNLEILMRHRAVLFGLVGVLSIVAAFKPALQPAAFASGLASVVSFLALAWSTGGYNAALVRVVSVDAVALVCLVVGLAARIGVRMRAP